MTVSFTIRCQAIPYEVPRRFEERTARHLFERLGLDMRQGEVPALDLRRRCAAILVRNKPASGPEGDSRLQALLALCEHAGDFGVICWG